MARGGGRGREPVGWGEGEIEERDAGCPHSAGLVWFRIPAPKVFSLLSTLPQMLTRTMALWGQGEEGRDSPERGS